MSDASGSKYSAGHDTAASTNPSFAIASKPASKPAFMPTRSSGGSTAFNPLRTTGSRPSISQSESIDDDGWGQDAPQVTRTQLEKVHSAYQPTKVNMRDLASQTLESSDINNTNNATNRTDVIKGGYEPIGKVDIAALRRQAQGSVSRQDDRPTVVKGSYEPVGKVDIAAIRAKAQPPSEIAKSSFREISPAVTGTSARSSDPDDSQPLSQRSIPFSSSERLMTLPKPKISNKYGSNVNSFPGTKVPKPIIYGLESKVSPVSPPVGASRTFADEGGKTPAQIWQEKKARERGLSASSDRPASAGSEIPASLMAQQNSGSGEWKSGYSGKSWAAVQTNKTGQPSASLEQQRTGEDETMEPEIPNSPASGIGALRDRFKGTAPMGAATSTPENSAPGLPSLDTLSGKSQGSRKISIPKNPERSSETALGPESEPPVMPSPPPQPRRPQNLPTPVVEEESEELPGSPIRVAMPVSRGEVPEIEDARGEQFSPPPTMPTRSLAQVASREIENDEKPSGYDAARGVSQAAAAASFGHEALHDTVNTSQHNGKCAVVQYDYEKAEDNELELNEGEQVTNIEMVDDDWWMGENPRGETGLFPSSYVELVQDDGDIDHAGALNVAEVPSSAVNEIHPASGPVATALYDYEAAEDNELSFPENAKIRNLVRTFILTLLRSLIKSRLGISG